MGSEWIQIVIPGPPVVKGRARITRTGHSYTPKHTATFEARVAYWMREAMGDRPPYDGPVGIHMESILPRPKNLSRKKDPDGLVFCPKRPDLDNLVKAVTDAMMAGGVLRDDAQIVAIQAQKLYAEKDGEPRTVIRVREVVESPTAS